jgi:hypothetical protein
MKKPFETTVDLPFEEGKTYKTKFATGEMFDLTKINRNHKGDIAMFWGIYHDSKELGLCPLAPDRLNPHKTAQMVDVEVCDACGEPCEKCKEK